MDCSASQFSECSKVLLQVEISARHRSELDSKYLNLTGKRACGESFIPTENKDTHHAPILSVFCVGAAPTAAMNLRALGFVVGEFQHGEFDMCVLGEKMFWTLVRNGYRIGTQVGIKPAPIVTKCVVKEAVFA